MESPTGPGKTFCRRDYDDDHVVLDLTQVEDFSTDSIIASPNHDQLPSVEEARIYAGKTVSNQKVGQGSRLPSHWRYIALGICIILVLFGIIIAIVKNNRSPKKMLRNYEQIVNSIALNATSDFKEEYSYQSIAKRWVLMDTKILSTATKEEIKERYALYCILLATNGNMWESTKDEPVCHWDGLTCRLIGDSNVVVRMNLRHDELHGKVPEEILLLKHLEVLNLNANHELKSIPIGLCDSHSIVIKADCKQVDCKCCSECGT